MAVLLLNGSMDPLNVISRRRLVLLLTKERVAFLTGEAEAAALSALRGRTLPDSIAIVRLLRTVHVPRRVLKPNRRNLLTRDAHTCQYCGFTGPAAELTVDHIMPISRGGAVDTWENVVIACKRCNWRKANRRPEEAGLRLLRQPRPLTHDHSHVLFQRHPDLKAAYEALIAA